MGMTSTVLGIAALGRPAELRRALVDVPEWGGQVLLREFTGAERTELLAGIVDLFHVFQTNGTTLPQSGAELRQGFEYACRVVQLAWIDERGAQVVTGDQVDLLRQQDLAVIFNLAGEALKLSRLAPTGLKEAKKNLAPIPTTDSGSA